MRSFSCLVVSAGLLASMAVRAQSTVAGPPAPDAAAGLAPVVLQRPVPVPARQLTLKVGLDRAAAAPGDSVTLVADITPQTRIHVYAPGATGYLPIELTIDAGGATMDGPPQYPPSAHRFLEAVNESADVYDEHFQIRQPVTIPPDAAAAPNASVAITGVLKYQACNDTICFKPETVKLSWTVPIAR
jgi:hypothetical protein